jgi:nitrate/nitrite transporter NarK
MDPEPQPQGRPAGLCVAGYSHNDRGARTTNAWLAVFLIAIAAGAHPGWSANLYTLASDMFPRSAVGSVVGFATMAGAISGMGVAKAVGYILQHTGSCGLVLILAGLAYLVALGLRTGNGAAPTTGAGLVLVSGLLKL